jgi:hypothetical protein
MYPTRTPAPFAVELKRTQVKNNRINIMADSSLTPMGRDLNSFNFNHDNLLDHFDGRKELTVFPLPGFRYTTDLEVAKAYFKGLK